MLLKLAAKWVRFLVENYQFWKKKHWELFKFSTILSVPFASAMGNKWGYLKLLRWIKFITTNTIANLKNTTFKKCRFEQNYFNVFFSSSPNSVSPGVWISPFYQDASSHKRKATFIQMNTNNWIEEWLWTRLGYWSNTWR